MKSLSSYLQESHLGSRMKGYGIIKTSVKDFMDIRTYGQLVKIADTLIEKMEECDCKCGVYLGSTIYDPKDYSWFVDGLKHLKDFGFSDEDIINIDTSYKYKNRFHPTLSIYHNGAEMHWNMKESIWEK